MKFLAHRGHWLTRPETNSVTAFDRAWSGGHGIETDLRDLDGEVVVSHDPPKKGALSFVQFLEAYSARGANTPLALNIKADGLTEAVASALADLPAQNFFVFDMSIPDSLHYLRRGLPVFLCLSEYEGETPLLEQASGIWLDAFEGEWWSLATIRSLMARGKSVAIVSPELHRRPHEQVWQTLKGLEKNQRDALMLCTDFPDAAEKFFRD
jgi:glycerophosphoryl diester phosphodiesterase